MATKGETTMPKTEYVIEPGRQDITSTIILDAPRELVFKAYTDPELFARWWGPRRYKNEIDKFESRSGGSWRVVQVGADGSRHGFRGVNHDVVAPERICATFEYEGFPGHGPAAALATPESGGTTSGHSFGTARRSIDSSAPSCIPDATMPDLDRAALS